MSFPDQDIKISIFNELCKYKPNMEISILCHLMALNILTTRQTTGSILPN